MNKRGDVTGYIDEAPGSSQAMELERDDALQRTRLSGGVVVWVFLLLALVAAMSGCSFTPSTPFDAKQVPPTPDYAKPDAWLALPGDNGRERSTPPGMTAVSEADAPADVFFIHPTTIETSKVWVAPFDASDRTAPLNPPVLLGQASVFNGCCRIYVPNYRQATLAGLRNPDAMDVAYADIARAFRYYLEHDNHGRPFIIASHSQGTGHAVRLLQEEVLNTPYRKQLIAAYLIGGYVPDTFGELGLPVCGDARQTGCVLSYNTAQAGRSSARIVIRNPRYWWRGSLKTTDQANAVCVNPLDWRQNGEAPASANSGSLPFPKKPFPAAATTLPALVPHLTGAACRNGMLEVDVPWSAPSGFVDGLSVVLGSFHLNDYGLFYDRLRQNAVDRVDAWRAEAAKQH